ncbi:hypothetical protein CDL15_Pgr011953 [Punica granatum]|uniref:Uncharacterized protein n=1 Tax=Punica granatum TaxID=22663 RepID=A0A218WC87_PUNGR|nr:hypothetical protein CDL15_Pgr011953 [Punica granatum]
MVGGSYAAVPLYWRFCQATGYGGTIQRRESVEEKIAHHAKDETVTKREIAVQFNADVADGMQWKFTPTQREVLSFATVHTSKILFSNHFIDAKCSSILIPDLRMGAINNIVLSYTFFKVSKD